MTSVAPDADDQLDPWVVQWMADNPLRAGVFDTLDPAILPLARGDNPFPVTREIARITDEGVDGIPVRIYEHDEPATGVLVYLHGGGFCIGSIGLMDNVARELAHATGATVVSVEYRLAPEHPHPAPIDDCHAGIVWLARHARELGIDPDRIIVMGVSAGAGLAAGIALLARDRGFPTLSHQVLLRPMLDDRMRTHSSQMLDGEGVWDRNENAFGWAALLGRQSEVSPYAAPSRAVDLSGLPRTYLDTGSADTFRDETLEYAGRLSAHGVSVDLHVWGGGFHGFENQVPDAALSRICRTVQDEFIRRALAPARQAKG